MQADSPFSAVKNCRKNVCAPVEVYWLKNTILGQKIWSNRLEINVKQ
jgi:hypothetical protein